MGRSAVGLRRGRIASLRKARNRDIQFLPYAVISPEGEVGLLGPPLFRAPGVPVGLPQITTTLGSHKIFPRGWGPFPALAPTVAGDAPANRRSMLCVILCEMEFVKNS